MGKITVVGAGVVGMAVASMLSRAHEVTIVARNLPGDGESLDWASPWAGAVFLGLDGCGSKFLRDVADPNVQQVRGQTILVKTDYNKIMMRHGKDYTYVIPRLDGTAILGGIKQVDNTDPVVDVDLRNDILKRVHENAPEVFKDQKVENVDIIRDNVGIRPARTGGVRVEKEVTGGQNIVHAYGTGGGGYVFSFGVARAAGTLVNDYLFTPPAKL
ncbi:hypothetical protein ACHAPJ_011333 [Fusarium lateritium]